MLKVAIVDDDEDDINDLVCKLEEISGSFDICRFPDEKPILAELRNGRTFDIIFMDIQLKGANGIETVKEINALDENIDIIYYSAYIDFTQDIFETCCVYFLLKPVQPDKLRLALEKIFERHKDNCIVIKYSNKINKIAINDLAFIESDTKWLNFVYANGLREKYYLPFAAVEDKLPPQSFIRTHKSYIVNLRYMTKASRTEVTLCGRWNIPISRTFIKSVRDEITLFLGGI